MENIRQHVRSDLPKGAVMMTRENVLSHQKNIIHAWKPRSDVWPLLYSRSLLSFAGVSTVLYFNYRFRRKLGFRDAGSLVTGISLSFGTAGLISFMHPQHIINKLLLLEISCPVCLQFKSAFLQAISGVVMPLILTPFANFAIATNCGIYSIPHPTDVRGIAKLIRLGYQPIIPHIAVLFIFHALLAGFITHSQIKSFLRVQNIQYLIEADRIAEHDV